MFVMGLLPTINDITMNVMKLNYLTSSLDKKICLTDTCSTRYNFHFIRVSCLYTS